MADMQNPTNHVRIPASVLVAGWLLTSCLAPSANATWPFTEGCATIHELIGAAAGDNFGWVSNRIPDVDGDGVTDMIITATGNDAGGAGAGRVYIHSGATGEELFFATGGGAGWVFGHDATAAGDADGDGVPDFIVGAPGNGTGRAVICSGVDGSQIHLFPGEFAGDGFGYRVHGGGDYDGDGTGDFVIGARLNDANGLSAGRAYVYSGADFSLIDAIDGLAAGDMFGSGVWMVGDVSQPPDGRCDIVVGAMGAGPTSGGLAYVYGWDGADSTLIHTLAPTGSSVNFGQWFMNGGFDVDGDGTPDIYVNDFPSNRAYIYSGATGDLIWELDGAGEGGGFGIGRIIEDINGDGHADMIMASWASSVVETGAGKAFIYSGIDGSIMQTYTHTVAGANFGFDANGMGDVNGDGVYDFLVTAASDFNGRGRAYVIDGRGGIPRIGDVNQDCVVDFTDILKLITDWGECPPPPAFCRSDFDGDGFVTFADLLIVLQNWDV